MRQEYMQCCEQAAMRQVKCVSTVVSSGSFVMSLGSEGGVLAPSSSCACLLRPCDKLLTVSSGHNDVAQYLLEAGAVCNEYTFDGDRCHYAALNLGIRTLLRQLRLGPHLSHHWLLLCAVCHLCVKTQRYASACGSVIRQFECG